MKRITRFLARLYPSTWRNRYGAEFDQLLEDTKPTGHDAVDVLKGAVKMQVTTGTFMKTLFAFAMAGALAAVAISFAMPVRYQSIGAITVVPTADTAVIQTPSARNQVIWNEIQELKQRIVNPRSLTAIIQQRNLYPYERARMPVDDVIALMAKNIVVRPIPSSATNHQVSAFVIEFNYSDGLKAQSVTADLMSRFIDDNVLVNTTLKFQSLPTRVRLDPLDTASLPLKPTSPNRWTIATAGLFAGLLAGLTWALIKRRGQGSTA